jgi:hypothetical protein
MGAVRPVAPTHVNGRAGLLAAAHDEAFDEDRRTSLYALSDRRPGGPPFCVSEFVRPIWKEREFSP